MVFQGNLAVVFLVIVALFLAGCGKTKAPDSMTVVEIDQSITDESKLGRGALDGGTPGDSAPGESAPGDGASDDDKPWLGETIHLEPIEKTYDAPPPMTIDAAKAYFATIKTTEGDIRVELFSQDAPVTANNFIFLAREDFYDGVKFHRIIKPFMIQTGDPLGNGMGGPGYQFQDELPPKRSYEPGIVAMANAGPNTNGSQFFICTGPQCQALDQVPNYTQFGRVIEGMDVVEAIASVPVTADPFGEMSRPTEDVNINDVIIETKEKK